MFPITIERWDLVPVFLRLSLLGMGRLRWRDGAAPAFLGGTAMSGSIAIEVVFDGTNWSIAGELTGSYPAKVAALQHAFDKARGLASSGVRAQVYVQHEPFVTPPDLPDGEGLTSRTIEGEQRVARV
jgi:hypothetical protein